MDGRLSNPSLGTRSNKAVGSHIETRTLIPFRHRRSNMAPAINRKTVYSYSVNSLSFILLYYYYTFLIIHTHTHTHFSLLLKRYKRIPSGLFFEWIDVPLDVHKSVRRENSTPRNPKLNSVVAWNTTGARRGKLRPELPLVHLFILPTPASNRQGVVARFPRAIRTAFSLLRRDFPPLSSLVAANVRSRPLPRRELLEKAFPPRPRATRFPNDRAKLNRNFSTWIRFHTRILFETQKC